VTNWVTVSALASAGSTLVLAAATFSSVRSASRSAAAAERLVLAGLRPVLAPSRSEDNSQKVMWADGHRAVLPGACGYAEVVEGVLYLAMSLRNISTGIGVLQGWEPSPQRRMSNDPHVGPEQFRPQSRDLYVPAGETGFWHAAIRDPEDPALESLSTATAERQPLGIDLLYTDHEGGQRTISRFAMHPREADDLWYVIVSRHWNLDRPDPR
jgi:hypothetical protein